MEIEKLGLSERTRKEVSLALEKSGMSLTDFMEVAFNFYIQAFNEEIKDVDLRNCYGIITDGESIDVGKYIKYIRF